jgi:anti-anti-sigma factor
MLQETLAMGCEMHWEPTETAPSAFELRVVEAGRMALARVEGPLDVEHATRLLNRLQPLCRTARRLVIDLRRADYIDSSGVRALMLLHSELEGQGGELRLVVRPESRVERTLSLLRLHERFAFYTGAQEAWCRTPRVLQERIAS